MRRFQVTVNGKIYDVGVAEAGESTVAPAAPAPVAPAPIIPAPVIPAPVIPAPVIPAPTAPAPPAQISPKLPEKTAAPANAKEVINAPMPGKILSLKVNVGQSVKAGDLILILEAMKMENEIFCGENGTVQEIRIKEGDSVNPGDVLVAIG